MKHMNLVIATANRHKVEEIGSFLGAGVTCWSMKQLGDPPVLVEDGQTFAENASRKCCGLARWMRAHAPGIVRCVGAGPVAILADDSGLEVDGLQGAPGIHSARFAYLDHPDAQGNAPDAENNEKLLRRMAALPDPQRTARFRCVLAFLPWQPDLEPGAPVYFDGVCEGRILNSPVGSGGFGYDPLFVPDGFAQSFSELGHDVKNRISHRAKALARLREHLLKAEI